MGLLGLVHDLDRARVAHISNSVLMRKSVRLIGVFTYAGSRPGAGLISGAMVGLASTVTMAPAAFFALDVAQLALAGGLVDHPLGRFVPLQRQLHHAQGPAPGLAITAGTPLTVPALRSTPGRLKLGWLRCGEHAVLVAHHHGINARHLDGTSPGSPWWPSGRQCRDRRACSATTMSAPWRAARHVLVGGFHGAFRVDLAFR